MPQAIATSLAASIVNWRVLFGWGALIVLFSAAGIVTCRQRPGTASGVMFVTVEDETGLANVIVHKDVQEKQRHEVLGATLLGIYGQVSREGEVIHLIARRLVDRSALLGALTPRSRDFH